MALIICSECGRQISDKAGSCPGCGCPISIAEPTVSDGAQVYGTVKCRECEYTMPGDIEYCQNCGAELRDIYSGTDYNSIDKKSQSMASLIEEYKQQHTYEEVEEEKESVFSVLSLVFLLTAILLIFVNPLLSVILGLPTIICLLISHLQKNRKATCGKVAQGIILFLIVIGCIFSFFDEMEPTKEDTYETARMRDTEVLDEIEKNNEQSELIKARENDDRGEESEFQLIAGTFVDETIEDKRVRIGNSVGNHIYDTAVEIPIDSAKGRKVTYSKCEYNKEDITYETLFDYIENYVKEKRYTNQYFIVDFGDGTCIWCDGAYGMVDYGNIKNGELVEHIGYYRVSNNELEYRTVESVVEEKQEMIDEAKDSWNYAEEETGKLYDTIKDDFKEVFGSN